MIRKIVVSLFLCVCAFQGSAQVETGIYSFGSFQTLGFDTIDRGTLNVHFSIPIVGKTGRGIPFQYALVYDGLVWAPSAVSGPTTWSPDASFGLHGYLLGEGYKGYLSYSYYNSSCGINGQGVSIQVPQLYNFQYHDQFGAIHSFNYSYNACTSTHQGSGSPSDGSGYTLLNIATVVSASGVQLTLPTIVNGAINSTSATISDSNGNQITNNGSGVFTDTIGVKPLTISGSGTASSPKIFSYLTLGANPNNTNPPSASATITFKTYSVRTAFACAAGDFNKSVDLADRVTLADGSYYQFAYEPTPNSSLSVTGRLASITLPSGGTISYAYTGGTNGINCTDGTPATLTRTMAGSSWTFSRTIGSGTSPVTSHTNVSDANGNNFDYDFVQPTSSSSDGPAPYYEVNRNAWTGAKTGAHTYSQQTCYNGHGPQCLSTAIALPITQLDTFQQFSDGDQDGTTTTYNSYGEVTEIDTHDYGSPYHPGTDERGAILSKQTLVYGGNSAPANLVSAATVTDATGNISTLNTYAYDQTTPVKSSGVPSHVTAAGSPGNLTTQTTYSSSSASYTSTYTYEDTGSLLTSVDPVNGTTTYSYDSTFTFPTGTTLPTPSSGVAMNASAGYDQSYTGLPMSSTDVNGNKTSVVSYDPLLRPTEVDYPTTAAGTPKTTFNYSPTSVSTHVYQTSSVYEDVETRLDGYGRTIRIGVANGSGWYLQDTCYDGNSNAIFRSYNYTSSSLTSAQVCSGAGDTYSYDGLNRITKVAHGDGTSIGYVYTGRAFETTDEGGVSRISQVDGLGRPTLVCEVTSTPVHSIAPASCGMDIAGTGFITSYAYNLANHSTTVTQGFGTSVAQSRSFTTDWLGRTVQTTEPERGTTNYTYAQNSTGLIVTRKRPQANQTSASTLTTTTTQYDTLSRPLSISYADANTGISGYVATPGKAYIYDQTNAWGNSSVSLGSSKGRLTREASVVGGVNGTGQVFGYDSMGRVVLIGECRPSTCGIGTDWMNYSYDLAGDMLTSTDGNNVTTTYGYTVAGELNGATSSKSDTQDPAALISSVTQGAFGPTSFHLGNGLNAVNSFDTLGRWNGRWVCNGSTSASCGGGTQLDGSTVTWRGPQATAVKDTYANQTSTYGYDAFNRLTSNTGGSTSYSYTYDLLGNRLSQNSQTINFNGNNQMVGFSYDAAGNLLQDAAGNNYTYDAEGNVLQVTNTSVGTVKYTYDGANRRVRVDKGSSYQEYDFNAAGQRVSTWNGTGGTTNVQGKYYAGSQPIGYYSGGSLHFEHQDWLGTERIRTTYNGAVEGRYSQAAFGDNYSASGTDTDDNHYASLDLDAPMQTGHAMFRELDTTHGRWSSPDPYDGSYNIYNPQSFNRYVYALDRPTSLIDASGLDGGDGLNDCGDSGGDNGDNGDGGGSGGSGNGSASSGGGDSSGSGGSSGYPPGSVVQDQNGTQYIVNPDGSLTPLSGGPSVTVDGSCADGAACCFPGSSNCSNWLPVSGFTLNQQIPTVGPTKKVTPTPLSFWDKVGGVVGCLGGLDPEYAKPLAPAVPGPQDSTDSPETVAGQRTLYGPSQGRKNGGLTPYNPSGNSSQTPDGAANGASYLVGAVQCIENLLHSYPSQ